MPDSAIPDDLAPDTRAALDAAALDQVFRMARTHSAWLDRPVSDDVLRELYDLVRMGPTAVNGQPMRVVFVRTPEGKARLRDALAPGNVEKTMAAPVTAIVAYDRRFHGHLPTLFPHVDARAWFVGNDALIESTASLNAALQGGYLILAARALGLDAGPMAGFDAAKVDAAFFAGEDVHAIMLVNLGHGDAAKLHLRNPRLAFEQAARLA